MSGQQTRQTAAIKLRPIVARCVSSQLSTLSFKSIVLVERVQLCARPLHLRAALDASQAGRSEPQRAHQRMQMSAPVAETGERFVRRATPALPGTLALFCARLVA